MMHKSEKIAQGQIDSRPIESFSPWVHATRTFHLAFLRSQGLLPEHDLLDIGCGPISTGEVLIDYLDADRYVGIDNNPDATDWASNRIRDLGLKEKRPVVTLISRLSEYRAPHPFDYMTAFSLLIHLDAQGMGDLFALAAKHLSPNGRLFGNVNVGDSKEEKWGNGVTYWNPLFHYQRAGANHHLVVESLGDLRSLGLATGNRQDDQLMLCVRRSKTE